MDKFDRIQQLHRIFKARRHPVSISTLERALDCSRSSVQRSLDHLRNDLQAPLDYDKEKKGWYYAEDEVFELPGLWMTADELQSLVMLLNALDHFGQGMLSSEFEQIEQHIHKILQSRDIDPDKIGDQFKILPFAHKPFATPVFKTIGEALIQQQQILLHYTDFSNKKTRRTISPQQIVYYRDNWYLDAWCHKRNALRTFALSRISQALSQKEKIKKVSKEELQSHFSQGYGMFAGQPKRTARLRFLSRIARDIAQQQWHPNQKSEWDGNEYLLEIPFSEDIELIGDILRHTPDVIVEAPAALREAVRKRLLAGLDLYE